MGRYCLDASFVLGWLLPAQDTPAANQRWLAFSRQDELLAPALLWAEVTSVLHEHAHRARISRELALDSLQALLRLPIGPVHQPEIYHRAFRIAGNLGWSRAYDAVYLATAEREGAELITLDNGMYLAALRLSVPAALIRS